jgi:DNA repair exonuclease SbcCD ATPase subunit
MDSFIDRLAHRFTAQEIIKANATAEAEELKRTREQVRQYEVCLEEMKQVNESMKNTLSKLEEAMSSDLGKEEGAKLSAEDLGEINEMLDEVMAEMKRTQAESLQQQEEIANQLQEIRENLSAQLSGQMQDIQSMLAEDISERMQNVQGDTSDVQNEMVQKLQNIQEAQDKLSGQLVMQMHDVHTMQEIQSQIPGHFANQIQMAKEQILEQMKTANNPESGAMFSDLQIAVLKELNNSQIEASSELLGGKLSEQKELLTDYVHKESVKVYRNVQAVVVDEANKQTESIGFTMSKVTAKNQLMFRLVVGALACSGASLAASIFLVLKSLGIL